MTPRNGFALVGALLALVLVALFGASMADIATSETHLTRNGSRFRHALAEVDACAADVIRALPLGWTFTDALTGPDGASGTGDDGILPAPSPCLASAAPIPTPNPRIRVAIESMRHGGRRTGTAIVGRAAAPGPRAALWLSAGERAGRVTGALTLIDASGAVPPWAGLASPSDPTILDAWVSTTGVVLTPPTGPPAWAPPPPIAAIIDAARTAGALPAAAALVPAPPATVQLAIAEGDLTITAPRWLTGALVVTGHLRIDAGGVLTGDALVVAADGLTIAAGGTLALQGALWVAGTRPDLLDVGGATSVTAHPPTLLRAATMLTLPHEARLVGWSDE